MPYHRVHQGFVDRLKQTLIGRGYASSRSPFGVDIKKLCEVTGFSPQNCRRFLRGDALPSYIKVLDISKKFNVCPGWLLFGDKNTPVSYLEDDVICISKKNIHMVFQQIIQSKQLSHVSNRLSCFLVEFIARLAQIDLPRDTLREAVNLALFSFAAGKEHIDIDNSP